MSEPLYVTPRLSVPADEISWTAVRASGPGGQNVNKVASKVVLRFDVFASTVLDPGTKRRLVALGGSRVDERGVLTLVSQDTRDQSRNLERARERLAELIRIALVPPKPRRPTKPTKGSQRRRLDEKKRHGDKKRARTHAVKDE
jgi:ribosome-associated protein